MAGSADIDDGEWARLRSAAYRMLGTLAEAEDAVQETLVRWSRLSTPQRAAIVVPQAWRMRVLGRVCLDQLRSARVRRETYVGEWLPEPVPEAVLGAPSDDPAARAEAAEAVSMALMIVLERMTVAERVSLLLHDVFGYSFAEVADVLGRTPAACRELASSGRGRVTQERSRAVSPAEHRRVNEAFRAAWTTGDVAGLVRVLDPDVVMVTDGGGRAHTAPAPVVGSEHTAAFLRRVLGLEPRLVASPVPVNGEPGLLATSGDAVLAVIATRVVRGRVAELWVVRNPDKLTLWAPG